MQEAEGTECYLNKFSSDFNLITELTVPNRY